MLRVIVSPQRVKIQDLGSALQAWKKWLVDTTKKNAKVGQVELADDIKCSAVESMVPENLECHLQLNARRLKKYDDVRFEIYVYVESCTGKILKPRTHEVASKTGSGDSLVKGKSKSHSKRKEKI